MSDVQASYVLSSRSAGLSMGLGVRSADSGILLCEGSTGLMGIPRSVRYQEGAGTGGRRLGSRAKVRPILLKLAVYGGLDAQRTMIDRLRRIVLAEDARLTATIDGESWTLGVSYDSGLEGDYSLDTANRRLTLVDLAMTAPQPYWEAVEKDTIILTSPEKAAPFLGSWANMPLSGVSGFLDRLPVTNESDAPSPVTWTLKGPTTSAAASISGRGWHTTGATGDGQTLSISPAWSQMPSVLLDGKPAWGMLATGSKFPALQPGSNRVNMSIQGAKPSTRTVGDGVLAENWASNPRLSFDRSAYASGGWDVMLDGVAALPTDHGVDVYKRTPGGRTLLGTVLNDTARPKTTDVRLLTSESSMEDTADGLLIHYGGSYGWAFLSMFPGTRVDWAKTVRADWPASIRICMDVEYPSQVQVYASCGSNTVDVNSDRYDWAGKDSINQGANVIDSPFPQHYKDRIGLYLYFTGNSGDVLVRSVMLTQDYALTDTVTAADATFLRLSDGTRWEMHPGTDTSIGYVDCTDPGKGGTHTATWSSTRRTWTDAGTVTCGMGSDSMPLPQGTGMTCDEYDADGRLLASSVGSQQSLGRAAASTTPQDDTTRIEVTAWGAQPRRVACPSVITGTDPGWFDGYSREAADWRDPTGAKTATPSVHEHARLHPMELTGGTTLTLEWTRLRETIR